MSDVLVTMQLTPSEVNVVLAERQRVLEVKAKMEERANCQHDWMYRGECRGDSYYSCYHCGESKWD